MTRLAAPLNLLTFAGICVALVASDAGASALYTLTLSVAGVAVAVTSAWTVSGRLRSTSRRWIATVPTTVRVALTMAPWVALGAVWLTHSLWWTQRPHTLRLFAVYLFALWSVWWSVGTASEPGRETRGRRAALWTAAIAGALGVQGAALGFAPAGITLSCALGLAGAALLSLAAFGSSNARLNLVSVVVSVLAALSASELAVRMFGIGANMRDTAALDVTKKFYSMTPAGSAFVVPPQLLDEFPPALVEINSLGIRGPEIPAGTPVELLLIGDSFVEARQVAWEQTVSARLADVFRARGMPGAVVGHGVRGWSPLLEWNWYLKVGRTLRPRTVLLCFFWNDLWPEGSEAETFRAVFDAAGRPSHFDVHQAPAWLWSSHLRTLDLLDHTWGLLGASSVKRAFSALTASGRSAGTMETAAAMRTAAGLAKGPPLTPAELDAMLTRPLPDLPDDLQQLATTAFWPGLRPMALWSESQRRAAGLIEDELRRFADDVAGDGARLVIMYVPNPTQVGGSECSVGRLFDRLAADAVLPEDSGVQAWLRQVAARAGVPFLDPTLAMREFDSARPYADAEPLYLRADCHWSVRGHTFIANWLADWYAGASEGLR